MKYSINIIIIIIIIIIYFFFLSLSLYFNSSNQQGWQSQSSARPSVREVTSLFQLLSFLCSFDYNRFKCP